MKLPDKAVANETTKYDLVVILALPSEKCNASRIQMNEDNILLLYINPVGRD